MMHNLIPHKELLLGLSKTIPAAEALINSIDDSTWSRRPDAEEWSVTEIICHLCDVDLEVHIPRMSSLLAEEEPFMPGIASDDWAQERDYRSQNGPQAFLAWKHGRDQLMDLLPPAGDPGWARRGRHTFFGRTSMWELACLVLEHDELHIEQIAKTIESVRNV